jgi:actin-related protein
MEVCFGDPDEEEPNLAASILRSVLKLTPDVRVLVVQNIVLAGGSCMVPGFKLRVQQEMDYLIDNYPEFQDLQSLKAKIKIPENQFPPNCLTWVGASLVSSLNTEIERFMTTLDDFNKNNQVLPDRFGEAFLFATRDEPYLNPEFEYKNQYAK